MAFYKKAFNKKEKVYYPPHKRMANLCRGCVIMLSFHSLDADDADDADKL